MGSVILAFLLFCIIIYQIKPTLGDLSGDGAVASHCLYTTTNKNSSNKTANTSSSSAYMMESVHQLTSGYHLVANPMLTVTSGGGDCDGHHVMTTRPMMISMMAQKFGPQPPALYTAATGYDPKSGQSPAHQLVQCRETTAAIVR